VGTDEWLAGGSAVIILLPNRLEIRTMHALRDMGLSITTVSCRRRMLNVARPIPTLSNVAMLRPRPQSPFDFRPRSA
jgi:hypothetical protein